MVRTGSGSAATDVIQSGLTLSRYETQGNDFLIALLTERELVDLDAALDLRDMTTSDVARAACDRDFGLGSRQGYVYPRGADGFVIGVHNAVNGQRAGSVRMHLLNADGSLAEVSGNGLASLAFAAFDAGFDADGLVKFKTDAGQHCCTVRSNGLSSKDRPDVAAVFVEVTMKPVTVGSPSVPSELKDRIRDDLGSEVERIGSGHVGNPHLVIALRGPISAHRTAELGATYAKFFPAGVNVEFVWLQRDANGGSELMMAVWERGAGLTHSCGTGSVVAATLAREWGLVPDRSAAKMTTVPRGWEFGANADNRNCFGYRVHTNPPARLRVMAERIETDLTIRIDEVPSLLIDIDEMDAIPH